MPTVTPDSLAASGGCGSGGEGAPSKEAGGGGGDSDSGNRAAATHATTLSMSRYSSYAYPGASARQANYIVEHAAPAMLCLLRKAEPRPYTPLPLDVIVRATQPLDYTLRPSPHISHQAVIDFYRVCEGHYGLQCDKPPHAMELLTRGTHNVRSAYASRTRTPSSSATNAAAMNDVVATVSAAMVGTHGNEATAAARTAGAATREGVPPPPLPPHNVAGGSGSAHSDGGVANTMAARHDGGHNDGNFTRDVDRYRLSQLKRMAQHVDTTLYARVCNFYGTKEGCRRGAACDFVHIDRAGNVVPTRRSRADASPSQGSDA